MADNDYIRSPGPDRESGPDVTSAPETMTPPAGVPPTGEHAPRPESTGSSGGTGGQPASSASPRPLWTLDPTSPEDDGSYGSSPFAGPSREGGAYGANPADPVNPAGAPTVPTAPWMPTEPPPPPIGVPPYGPAGPDAGPSRPGSFGPGPYGPGYGPGPYGGPPLAPPAGSPGGPRGPEPARARPTGPGWLAVAVIAALIGAAVGAAGYGIADRVNGPKTTVVRSSAVPGSNTNLAGKPLDIQGLLAKVQPAVVSIGVSGSEGQGAGSGMILTADGEVLTNAHVISGATTIKVTLNGESSGRAADLVGADAQNDLALVKIRGASGLPTVELGTSETTRVGDQVIAIGNALALPGGPSVTEGIISAKDRTIDTYDNLIQTDAPINEGNSGGPLVNATGQVIGINTLVIRGTGNTRGVAEGLGFAIAVDTAKPIIDQLRKGGPKEGGAFLGVSSQTLTPDIKDSVDTGASDGAIVAEVVPGSAAADAGLQRYDVIVDIDGQQVKTSSDVSRIIRSKNPGDKVSITYYRGQDKKTVTVTLGSRPAGG